MVWHKEMLYSNCSSILLQIMHTMWNGQRKVGITAINLNITASDGC